MEKWTKRGEYRSLDDYVKHFTGTDILSFTNDDHSSLDMKEYMIPNLDKVADRLKLAAENQETVQIVADYDVDGVTSSVLLIWLCNYFHIPYLLTIPKRMSEGYGLSPKIMERIPDNISLLLTIDNGIKAIEAVDMAKTRNMDVIILDHHQAETDADGNVILPNADIIIDPEVLSEGCGYTHYCGAGLAFKLIEYMVGKAHPFTYYLSGIAAIGTIGDSVELFGDNRKIVKMGLNNMLKGNTSSALKKILKQAKIHEASSAMDIAFNVCPMINAPGRLFDDGAKMSILALLGNQNPEKEDAAIAKLQELNEQRKKLVSDIMESVPLETYKENEEHVIFYCNADMPEGISGIIAGQISQATNKPVFAMSKDKEGNWKGSARSQSDDYSLSTIMQSHADLFVSFGGHAKAAGFRVRPENVEQLKTALEKVIPLAEKNNCIYYDLEFPSVRFSQIANEILSLEPFGAEFPTPVIRIKGKLDHKFGSGYFLLGEQKEHIKFRFKDFSAIAFRQAEKFDPNKHFVDMIGTVNWEFFNNEKKIQLNVIDYVCF